MPSVTIWNRIEPRARSLDMKAGLEARVFDPLWLLARQWQMGEFSGRDAGSPIAVNVKSTTAEFDRYTVGTQAPQPYRTVQPLEMLVEGEAIRPASAAADLRQAAEAGNQFFRMLDAAGLSRWRGAYLTQYPLTAPQGLDDDGQRLAAIVAGRSMDGVKLRQDLAHAGTALPAQPAIASTDQTAVLGVTRAFAAWYDSLVAQPGHADAWSPDRMEYSFAMAAAGDTGSLVAREYDGGSIEWHTFDRSAAALTGSSAQPVAATRRALAAPVTFRGMPARRFWELEDASVDIGALSAAAEDIGRLLLREFALIYGNDWFQIPLTVPAGSQVTIESLTVADTFGVTTAIPHYSEVDGASSQWRMFCMSSDQGTPPRLLAILPNAVGALDSAAIEDVLLLRDELADMAWGVETTAVAASGLATDRALAYHRGVPETPPSGGDAAPKYRLGSKVPDYWIPFLPVAVAGGPLRMRRGKLPTSTTGPMGRLLSYPGLTMFLEELPREGVHLERRYRYARGPDGSTYVWIGRQRSTGRGEGRSGLRFDYLEY